MNSNPETSSRPTETNFFVCFSLRQDEKRVKKAGKYYEEDREKDHIWLDCGYAEYF